MHYLCIVVKGFSLCAMFSFVRHGVFLALSASNNSDDILPIKTKISQQS